MDEGFPGTVVCRACFILDDDCLWCTSLLRKCKSEGWIRMDGLSVWSVKALKMNGWMEYRIILQKLKVPEVSPPILVRRKGKEERKERAVSKPISSSKYALE